MEFLFDPADQVAAADETENRSRRSSTVQFDDSISYSDTSPSRPLAEPDATESLEDILAEIAEIYAAIQRGETYDESRLDWLYREQEENSAYQAKIQEEHDRWREDIDGYCNECLETTRTFVPLNIFTSTQESLIEAGLTQDISKRILQKQCLWLVRMSPEEISRLHEADISNRFDTAAQMLDIIEMAAIYASLPETFRQDTTGKKIEWRQRIENTFKEMLRAIDINELPPGKVRAPVYQEVPFGPFDDLQSVRYVEPVVGNLAPRRSFTETCKSNSILSAFRKKDKKKKKKATVDGDEVDVDAAGEGGSDGGAVGLERGGDSSEDLRADQDSA